MNDCPEPLMPADVDLRGMAFMPVDIVRLFDSDLFALSTGDEFKAAFALWGKSFLQVPAASLPSDERILAHLSGCGPRWKKVRDRALHGWVKCSDGRFYQPVVAEKALEAWEHRKEHRATSENKQERQRRWRARVKAASDQLRAKGITPPRGASLETLEEMLEYGGENTPGDTPTETPVDANVDAGETLSRRCGDDVEIGRTGTGKKESSADADSSPSDDPPVPVEGGAKAKTTEGNEVREAFNAYNATAERLGLPIAKTLTDERRKKIRARIRASGDLPAWHEALERIATSAFLTGKTDRGFLADLDFVCQAKSFQRLIEGFYADKMGQTNGSGNGGVPVVEDEEQWTKRLRWGRQQQVWARATWGPAPNESNSRVPQHLVQPGDGDGWAEYQGDGR